MKFRPTYNCCGCMSLLVGTEMICLLTLLLNISIIAVASSQEPMKFGNAVFSPFVQVFAAAWALIGIPIVIFGGVGALYRMEDALRAFFWYLLASFFLAITVPAYLFLSGGLCSTFSTPEIQKYARSFACSFADTSAFLWTLIFSTIQLYLVYVVWSAAEEVAEAPFPELSKYSDVLKGLRVPSMGAKVPADVENKVFGQQQQVPPPMQQQFASSEAKPFYGNSSLSTAAPSGPSYMPSSYSAIPGAQQPIAVVGSQVSQQPQSFFPTPASGFSQGQPQSFLPGPSSGFSGY